MYGIHPTKKQFNNVNRKLQYIPTDLSKFRSKIFRAAEGQVFPTSLISSADLTGSASAPSLFEAAGAGAQAAALGFSPTILEAYRLQ